MELALKTSTSKEFTESDVEYSKKYVGEDAYNSHRDNIQYLLARGFFGPIFYHSSKYKAIKFLNHGLLQDKLYAVCEIKLRPDGKVIGDIHTTLDDPSSAWVKTVYYVESITVDTAEELIEHFNEKLAAETTESLHKRLLQAQAEIEKRSRTILVS